ncbi:uncharacterized protein LOC134453702 isoform X2 [Engraulis encrasicolus]
MKGTGALDTGPWLEKLHMADNAIDEVKTEGTAAGMDCIDVICVLMKLSPHLLEIDLGQNHVGEAAGQLLLDALTERGKAKLRPV